MLPSKFEEDPKQTHSVIFILYTRYEYEYHLFDVTLWPFIISISL